jgi:Nucleotidyl transferase AbiEii toxin, Type IV TA system
VSPATGLSDLLSALARLLPEWTHSWYLFGAQAVQVWGMPRLTADVDVTVRLRTEDPSLFVEAMRKAGFELRVADIEDFVERTRVLPFVHRASQIPVDVVLAGPGLEEDFLERARLVDLGGVTLPVISPEDLVVTKMLAARPKDLEDVRGILRERVEEMDLPRIRRILRLLEDALAQSDLGSLFDEQLAATKKPGRP